MEADGDIMNKLGTPVCMVHERRTEIKRGQSGRNNMNLAIFATL